ncbi:HAD-IA family hydrolase [Nakamurella flavida]|uniref:HAD-IA family hydrolase n=1 Tax=Nakamurella flavida TaxID=363630 RepID=A0A938YIU9_9ACTN|nr:HAD-IA family hydrolase [Nakamurella flavida]MBM9475406.1 HAD-IA family hydrolase [Nakamurella flavida]MBM9475506.1 HAD-IA family hydrolase [Nakamurella flavida]MDP9776986.1 sugar-phosphatase [Nakamurella flavida]
MSELVVAGVLFDLDGTLVDSTGSVNRNWTLMCESMGWPVAEVIGRFHGMPASGALRVIDPTLSDARIAELNAVLIAGETADTDGVVPLPGVVDLLAGLPADRWAIVTSCPPGLAAARLGAAGLPMPDRIITSADVTRGKPDPEPFRLGAGLLELDPARCLAVEDAPAGVASALAAGCQVMAVRTSHPGLVVEGVRAAVPDLAGVRIAVEADGLHVSW